MPSPNKLIQIATDEIGYLEKKSNKDLDSKTANAGDGNFTKYWRDMDPSMQGQPWCDCFVGWCFMKAYGLTMAQALQCGGTKTYYTPTSASFYKNANKWSRQPALGAQIFFENSERINHTGIVVGYTDTEVTTIEGNTADGSSIIANGGAVCRKTYKRNNSRIAGYGVPAYTAEEPKVTTKQFIDAVSKVAQIAQKSNWHYGDSHGVPPCSDGYISCDRLIARALWDLGFTDQQVGGMTVLTMDKYLTGHGFKKITDQKALQPGDSILMKQNGTSAPTAAWHAFVITAYNPSTGICSKYDEGSESRIRAGGFFANVPLNEWSNRTFFAGYRVPGDKEPNRLKPTGKKYTIESALNKGYCFDIYGGSMENKGNLNLYKKNGTPAQQFCIEEVKDGYVRIVNVKSGLVLDLTGGKAANKVNVQQYEWTGVPAQLWKMRYNLDGTITFESAVDGSYVMDAAEGKAANKTNIWIYKNNGTKAQRWRLV